MKKKFFFLLQVVIFCFIIQILPVNATQNEEQIQEMEATENTDDTNEVDETEETEEDIAVPENVSTEETTSGKNSQTKEINVEIQDGEVNTTGEATIKNGNGYVTFKGHVNPEILEDIYIGFFNMDTYEEYAYYLYKINDYKTSVELPAGNYFLADGGIPTDVMNEYPIENVEFTVMPNQACVVDFGVGMAKNQIGSYGGESETITISLEDEGNSDNSNIEEIESISSNELDLNQEDKQSNKVWGFIKNWSIIVVFIVALVLIYKKIKAKEEEDE